MKVIMLMYDSLNRHMLPPYGNSWTVAPNFRRLAEQAVTFDRSYVCSMPCMPARRDLHTSRPSFLHAGWGPIEPFDDSVMNRLSAHGVSTHLVSDHYHYWEDGGSTYHTRYNTWQFFRGQEGDPWIGQVAEPAAPANLNGKGRRQDWVNRQFMATEEQHPQHQTFAAGLDFIHRNHDQDNWLLHIETFDPHEPFWSHRKYKDRYPGHSGTIDGQVFDWPGYRKVQETPEQVEHVRKEYASLLTMCDSHLGDLLDTMDRYRMWDDTMLVVWTDHGFLLGEHNCFAKNWPPMYEEIAHTPLFIWDPRCKAKGQRRQALVQPAIDLGPTLLEFFGAPAGEHRLGRCLRDTVASDAAVREAAIFGYHHSRMNVTDGRYVLMRGDHVAGVPRYTYTLLPNHMRGFHGLEVLAKARLHDGFRFTRGCRVLQLDYGPSQVDPEADPLFHSVQGDLLYDLQNDPQQRQPIRDEAVEQRLLGQMKALMSAGEAPPELYQRLGL